MPTGSRVRANNVFGLVSDNPLPAGSTTINSTGLVNLPTIVSPTQHAVIVLDPLRVNGNPEIVIVTAHTALSTVATITRGAYGTTTRAHPQGTMWMHTPINEDYVSVLTSGTRPADPYEGQPIYETDTDLYMGYNGASWGKIGSSVDTSPYSNNFLANPPACRIFNNAPEVTVNGVELILAFNSERYDTDSMHSTVSNTGRITFNKAGLYVVSLGFSFPTNGTGYRYGYIRLNGTTAIAAESKNSASIITPVEFALSTTYKFAATNYIEAIVFQNSGGVLNVDAGGNYSPEFSATWVGLG